MAGGDQNTSGSAGPAAPASAPYLNGLNVAQRRAVEFGLAEPSRPLIVLAGPGTGKTRVITHRIARLLQAGTHEGPVEPEKILAVTFTVNAANQMRERLAEMVGAAQAERVNVHTFHGFGRRVVQRFGDRIGLNWARMQLIDSAQRTRLLLELMERHGLFKGRIAEGRRAVVPSMEAFIDACRNRGVVGSHAVSYGRAWSDRLRQSGAEPGEQAHAAEAARCDEFRERAALYEHYERACIERQWFSFDDLILQPIRILAEHPPAAAMLRDDYRHIVVDEFQDVNPAQLELLRLLAPPAPGPAGTPATGPDLCVVGDDDQAIYGFRGSSERAFADFSRLWAGHETIPLERTYRSGQGVLDVANSIILKASSRFRPDKKMELDPDCPAAKAGAQVEGVELESDRHAGMVIAAMIRADRAERADGEGFGRYAIIVRTGLHAERIGADLEVEGIPVRYPRAGITSEDGLRDLLAWISLLAAPSGPGSRAAAQRLLARPPFSVPIEEIAAWSRHHRGNADRPSAEVGVQDDPASPNWVDEEDELAQGQTLTPSGVPFVEWLAQQRPSQEGAQRFLQMHDELRRAVMAMSAGPATMAVIERTGLAHPVAGEAAALPDEVARARARRVGSLVKFLRFVRSREDRLDQPCGLTEFWSYYQDLSDQERDALESNETEDRIDSDREDAEEATDAVALLTAHRAKGLEYDTVFVAHVRPGGFPGKKQSNVEPMVPDELQLPWCESNGQTAEPRRQDEERRLFYVACTRARRRLVLLAKTKKSRKGATDYFIELEDARLLTPRAQAQVLARDGAAPIDPLETAARAGSIQTVTQRLGSRVVRSARLRLAELAADAEVDGCSGAEAQSIGVETAALMSRLAAAAHLSRHGVLPGWARDPGAGDGGARDGGMADLCAMVDAAANGGARAEPGGWRGFRKMGAPLRLNYSKIDAYERCPRCFYLRHVLGLSDQESDPQVIGNAAHSALEQFYRRFREAEAAGGDPSSLPTVEHLLAIGRSEFEARWPRSRPMDRRQLEQLLAQLRQLHERMHSDRLHILELEKSVRVPYEHAGQSHQLDVRMDRVDLAPDGRLTIIDYKTGRAWGKLRTPKPDDLQLGIYALALPALVEGRADAGAAAPEGQAEYWLLATGERGTIDLSMLNLDKVRQRIGRSIDGMLAGKFPRSKKCDQVCRVFPLGDDDRSADSGQDPDEDATAADEVG